MHVALYARKSTEQATADADATSVARQIESARAFATAKGWQVADAHIYADDAVSGAETTRLVNRQRLLAALNGAPPFQALIMRDASRFSRRDGDEAFGELKRLAQAGVEIWFYQDGTRFAFGTFGDNVVGFVRAEMNAEYRRQIAKWTREAMVRKAQAGHVTGGRVFGYDNVRVDGHVERRINEAQATVVKSIFALCASGVGYTRIAKQLNAERAPSPRPQQERPAGWSPSSVYEVLHRPLYRGQIVWNKTRKRDDHGRTAVSNRPTTDWMHLDQPQLRIVTEKVWNAVHARLRGPSSHAQKSNGRANPRRDGDSKYLLTGFARCATCGSSLTVLSRSTGRKKPRAYAYGCLAHAKRGDTICDNALVMARERLESKVLAELAQTLHPTHVRALIDVVFEALTPTNVSTNVAGLRRELKALDDKIAHLTTAIESGAALGPVVAKLQARQAERETLLQTIAAADAVAQLQVSRATVERKILSRIATWREKLLADGRQGLREAIVGPIRFRAVGKRYHFEGLTVTGQLIAESIGGDVSYLYGVPKGVPDKLETRFSGVAA